MFLFHRALNGTESLGDGIGLIVFKLLPLSLQSVPPVAEGVPDDPRHLGQAGLGLLPQCSHVGPTDLLCNTNNFSLRNVTGREQFDG